MSLLTLWNTSADQILGKRIDQVIGFAGDGKLKDKSVAAIELREFLRSIPKTLIEQYSQECLEKAFKDSGFALQDIVNEIGHRLGFSVTPGWYRGRQGEIGNDGLWESPEGHKIVIEVKTTDAYRIDLSIVSGYRNKLIKKGDLEEERSSILIVVGRQDTGDLEAQIRGSRHAWDVRLISVESLLRLLGIREDIEDPGTGRRIRSILVPREYTRVDEIIDVAFSAAEELIQEQTEAERAVSDDSEHEQEKRKDTPVNFNDACAKRVSDHLGVSLIRRSRATYSSPDENIAVLCAVSKEYGKNDETGYWFAFHPHQLKILSSAQSGYVSFGCGSPQAILFFPIEEFQLLLDGLNQTTREDGSSFWHVHIYFNAGLWELRLRKGEKSPDISKYVLS